MFVGLILVVESAPGATFWNLATYGLGVLICLTWIIRFAGWKRTPTPRLGPLWPWLVPPVVVVATVLMVWTAVPLRIRFELARGSFDQAASQIDPGSCDAPISDQISTYRIDGYTTAESAVLFHTGTFLFDDFGFAYLPRGLLTFAGTKDDWWWNQIDWTDLGDGWYAWTGNLPTNHGFGYRPQCLI